MRHPPVASSQRACAPSRLVDEHVFPIHLPPLRHRVQDIPALVAHFLSSIARKLGRQFSGIEPASLERLRVFSWPGNVRQLGKIVEQSAILCDGPLLEVLHRCSKSQRIE